MKTIQDLAIQAKHGDAAAFNVLFKRLYTSAFQHARKYLKCHEDAEDAISVAFAKAWHDLPKWNPKLGTFEAWFFRVTQNTTINVYRKLQREKNRFSWYSETLDADECGKIDVIPDPQQGALEAMIVSQGIEQLERALVQMPRKRVHRRIAWILKRLEGYSYKEVSEILRKPQSTCQNEVYWCDAYLRNKLTDADGSRPV